MVCYKWVNTEAECLFKLLLDENDGSKESNSIKKNRIDRIVALEPSNTDPYFWLLACTTYHKAGFINHDYDAAEKAIEYGERAQNLHTTGSSVMPVEQLVLLYTCLTASMLLLGNQEKMEKYLELRIKYETELGEHPDEN